MDGRGPSSEANASDIHRMLFNDDHMHFDIDGDLPLRARNGLIVDIVQNEVLDVMEGNFDEFESFRQRLVQHYNAKKYIHQDGVMGWKKPPQPDCSGLKEPRFTAKFQFPTPTPTALYIGTILMFFLDDSHCH